MLLLTPLQHQSVYYREFIGGEDIICLNYAINSSTILESLIVQYKPTLVKMDCELCEYFLLGIPEEILKTVSQYVLEVHSFPDARAPFYYLGEKVKVYKHQFVKFFQDMGYTVAGHNLTGEDLPLARLYAYKEAGE